MSIPALPVASKQRKAKKPGAKKESLCVRYNSVWLQRFLRKAGKGSANKSSVGSPKSSSKPAESVAESVARSLHERIDRRKSVKKVCMTPLNLIS